MRFIDPATLDFLLYDWLDAEGLTRHARFAGHSRETFQAVLDLAARIADDHFAPHYKRSDHEEPRLEGDVVRVLPEIKDALRIYAESGLFAASFDESLGGAQVPSLVATAASALTMAANIATAAYPMLTAANARLLALFGTPGQVDAFARPQIEGRWFGTMCLSEPQAGSSLADIVTRAVEDGADPVLGPRYRLFGSKMWISAADQDISENIVHLVLAKVPGADGRIAPGLSGMSLFAVPKFLPGADGEPGALGARNDVAVAGLNHKMGYRGTVNCVFVLGDGTRYRPLGAAGAIGFRIGAVGQGLAIMFQMMNEARIAVGVGAAALACRGYAQSLAYARDRRQGRSAAARGRNVEVPPQPIIVHADVRRMLLTQKVYAEGALALVLYCARLVDQETAGDGEAASLLGLLTPVAKSWPSEFGLVANDLAIQVHGGYGYTRDFDVEQVYRDNRLNPIHEGTHGIQAMDLLGRKILRAEADALALLGARIADTVARTALTAEGALLQAAFAEVGKTVAVLRGEPADRALHNASAFLSAFGHVVVAWLWLDQAGVPAADPVLRESRAQACRYFFATELPRARQQLELVRSLDDKAATFPEELF